MAPHRLGLFLANLGIGLFRFRRWHKRKKNIIDESDIAYIRDIYSSVIQHNNFYQDNKIELPELVSSIEMELGISLSLEKFLEIVRQTEDERS